MNKFETLEVVSIAISTEDKLYLIHKNFLNNERKVNNSFSQYQVLESIRLSMKKSTRILINLSNIGYAFERHSKSNITLHNGKLSGIIIRAICNEKGVLCARILIVCLYNKHLRLSFRTQIGLFAILSFCVKFESGRSSESGTGNRSMFLWPNTRNEMKPTTRKKLMLKIYFYYLNIYIN